MKIYDYDGHANVTGERIRKARLAKKLSQKELAIKLELKNVVISQKVISRIEKGERFLADYELWKISEILDVEMLWLVSGEERKSS